MEQQNTSKVRQAIYVMLKDCLLEVRAAESLDKTKMWADIFHNVPMMLEKSNDAEDYNRVYEKIIKQAKKYGMEEHIQDMFRNSITQS